MRKFSPWLVALLVLSVGIWTIYYPVVNFDFIQWDDDYNIYDNPLFKSGDIWLFWKQPYMGLYIPLVYTVWSGLYHLTDVPNPAVFHIFNVLMHTINSILVFFLIRKIITYFRNSENSYEIPALMGAFLFAIHPLQIGCVAWNSGGRDLLSACFALLSLYFYFNRSSAKDWTLSLIFFALGLFCKPAIVSLPALFFIIDKLLKKNPLATLPHFLTGLSFVPVTQAAQGVYMVGMTHQEWYYRPIIALDAIGFYISKLIAPLTLMVDYGRLPGRVIQQEQFWPYLILAIVTIALCLLFLRRHKIAWIALGICFLSLAPVLGLIPFNFQRISTVTDHYLYMPLVGIGLALAYFLPPKLGPKVLIPLSSFFIFLTVLAILRVPIWKDSWSFFIDMKEKNPLSHSAHIMLGDRLYKMGDIQSAEKLFREALIADPNSGVAAGNVAFALATQKKYALILEDLKKFIDNRQFDYINQVHPHTIAMVYLSYATALYHNGDLEGAFRRYCQVISYRPRPSDQQEAVKAMNLLVPIIKEKNPNANLSCP